ncbi:MAG: Ankyrin repeat protein, partial [Segetibacter sp.]|nr:Ankyrin repeat protein [Segetibacter sp.]
RRYFKTPLIFSVQEAKGLEYENVILLNFISANPAEFKEIINGVNAADLKEDSLQYARPADKSDKDAEIYKFYINSFYVAITRSVKNIYLFEKQVNHAALELLSLKEMTKPLQVAEQKSDKHEWLEEARRLEEQGKHEQAEQIRAKYLGYEYISPEQLEQIKLLALDPAKKENEVKHQRKQLFQYALTHHKTEWIDRLAKLQFQRAMQYMKELRNDGKEYAKNCRLGRKEEVKRIVNKYGPDFAAPDTSLTGLMMALHHAQDPVADMLLQSEASISTHTTKGLLPLDYLLQGYYKTTIYRHALLATKKTLIKYWNLVKPPSISVEVSKRRVNVGSHSMAFFLLVSMRCIEQELPWKVTVNFYDTTKPDVATGMFTMDDIMKYIECVPDEVLPPYRKQRAYVNSVLASHELEKDNPYNKMLFKRVKRGCYVVNAALVYE